MSAIPGVANFNDAWARKRMGKYGEINFAYISLEDLIQNKGKGTREQDKADLRYLKKAKTGKKIK
jgi:hypothetical protein